MAAFQHGKIKRVQVLGNTTTLAGGLLTATTLLSEGWSRITEIQLDVGGNSDPSTFKSTMDLALRSGIVRQLATFREQTEYVFRIQLFQLEQRVAQFTPADIIAKLDWLILYDNTSPAPGANNENADYLVILGD